MEYLLKNEPEDVISEKGIRIRKRISPILYKYLIPLTTKNKLHFFYESSIPTNRPVIFAPTHGIHDDIAASLKATTTYSYMLFGSLPAFFNSFDGISLWINGTILVDRKDKESRRASKNKMIFALKHGANIVMFPEGVWNKTENLIVQRLYPGIYDVAEKTGAVVVPMGIVEENGNVYCSVGSAFDICELERNEGLAILRDKMATLKYDLMDKYSHISRSDIGDEYWKVFLDELISTANGNYDYEIENTAQYIDKNIITNEQAFEHLKHIEPNVKTAFLF